MNGRDEIDIGSRGENDTRRYDDEGRHAMIKMQNSRTKISILHSRNSF